MSTIINSTRDLHTYLADTRSDIVEHGDPNAAVDAMQNAPHPPWGTDWSPWLNAGGRDYIDASQIKADVRPRLACGQVRIVGGARLLLLARSGHRGDWIVHRIGSGHVNSDGSPAPSETRDGSTLRAAPCEKRSRAKNAARGFAPAHRHPPTA